MLVCEYLSSAFRDLFHSHGRIHRFFKIEASNLYSMSEPQTLAELLASLPEEERFILTLHYLRSQSSSEIAELLSVPEKSVLVVIESGKKRLTAFLGI